MVQRPVSYTHLDVYKRQDNNCDGTTDEGLTTRYYFDFDGDGYGEAVSFIDACAPSGLYTTTIVGDCIADDADINPGATEICDGKDNDCDGQTDEGLTTRYYFDFDADGYGEELSFIDACAPDGFYTATLVGDCVADDADINPAATEVCLSLIHILSYQTTKYICTT